MYETGRGLPPPPRSRRWHPHPGTLLSHEKGRAQPPHRQAAAGWSCVEPAPHTREGPAGTEHRLEALPNPGRHPAVSTWRGGARDGRHTRGRFVSPDWNHASLGALHHVSAPTCFTDDPMEETDWRPKTSLSLSL